VKECFIELEKLLCEIHYYDDEFLRNKFGRLKIKKSFEAVCLMLKARLDELFKEDNI